MLRLIVKEIWNLRLEYILVTLIKWDTWLNFQNLKKYIEINSF